MNSERFASVWDAVEDTPVEAENIKLRSPLERLAMPSHAERVGEVSGLIRC